MSSNRLCALVTVVIVNTLTCFSQEGSWQILKTKNQAAGRSECGMATVGGKLYLLGGDGPAKEAEVFDPQTLLWTKKALSPVVMHHFEAVSFDGKIYVLDAFSSGGFPDQVPMSNVMIYDTKKDKWEKGGEIPAERRRAGAGAAEYNGKLYLVAGIQHGHSSGTTNMFDMYDPQTGKWTAMPDAPNIRDHCSATVIKDKLYVVGGRNTSYRDPNNKITFFSQTVLEVDCFDFKTNSWSTLPAKLPLGSGGGAVVNLNNILYYMGGERATATSPNGPKKNTFYLDPSDSNEWKETDSLHLGRNGMAAAIFNNKIYAAGGAGGGPGGPPPGGGFGNPGGPPPGNNPNPMPPPPGNVNGSQPPPPPNNAMRGPEGGSVSLEVFTVK